MQANAFDGKTALSHGPTGPGRLCIDYRLDCRLDHWLIDEFQDTSDVQWSVLQNLVDEVIQDPDRQRTFFCVGDVKQAIYGWRGGNPYLFRRIREQYGDVIQEESLDQSFRSCPPIIHTINRVFSKFRTLYL